MNLQKLSDYACHKCEGSIIKKIVLGIMGGFLIALGCAAFLRIYLDGGNKSGLSLFAGSFVFSTGFVMCTLIGGNIFTSNCVGLQSVFEKKQKHRHFWLDMLIVTVANYFGGALLAIIAWSVGMFGIDASNAMWVAVHEFCEHKINMSGGPQSVGFAFLSAIVTNILVIGALLVYILSENKTVGIIGLIMVITIFVIGGYQHVVADFFFTTLGLLMDRGTNPDLAWQTFAYCLVPVGFGNFIGGLIMIILCNIIWKKCKGKSTNKKTQH